MLSVMSSDKALYLHISVHQAETEYQLTLRVNLQWTGVPPIQGESMTLICFAPRKPGISTGLVHFMAQRRIHPLSYPIINFNYTLLITLPWIFNGKKMCAQLNSPWSKWTLDSVCLMEIIYLHQSNSVTYEDWYIQLLEHPCWIIHEHHTIYHNKKFYQKFFSNKSSTVSVTFPENTVTFSRYICRYILTALLMLSCIFYFIF